MENHINHMMCYTSIITDINNHSYKNNYKRTKRRTTTNKKRITTKRNRDEKTTDHRLIKKYTDTMKELNYS